MPVHNGVPYLDKSLNALRAAWQPGYELIVVDDASSDGSDVLAAALILNWPDARVLRLENNVGPAGARNAGAEIAGKDCLVFLDADVMVHPDTLSKFADAFFQEHALAAVFGSYDSDPADRHVVSRFRNLLHHYIHQQGRGPAVTFWTGCGAVRRDAFKAVGRFRSASLTCMEDIDYGHRLIDAGLRVELRPDIQCTHLKRWTLGKMIYTDVFRRGVPWTVMMLRRGRNDAALNVTRRERQSALAALTAVLFFVGGIISLARAVMLLLHSGSTGVEMSSPSTIGAVFILLLYAMVLVLLGLFAMTLMVVLQAGFYSFLIRRRALWFAAACLPLHIVYFLCAGAGAAIGGVIYVAGRIRGWLPS
jgi:GT2 family glycosyltransferase